MSIGFVSASLALVSAFVGSVALVDQFGLASSLENLIRNVALGAFLGFAFSYVPARATNSAKDFCAKVYDGMRSGAMVFGVISVVAYIFGMARAEMLNR